MLDVSQFMPSLNEMVVTGDSLVRPSCWSAKFALEAYAIGNKTAEEVLEMVKESKNSLDSVCHLTSAESNYSVTTTENILQEIIDKFTEFSV